MKSWRQFLCCPISGKEPHHCGIYETESREGGQYDLSPLQSEKRLCQRKSKLGLKDIFIYMKKGIFLYSQSFQKKFTAGWCLNLRQ